MRLAPALLTILAAAMASVPAHCNEPQQIRALHDELIATIASHSRSVCLDREMIKNIDALAPRLRALVPGSVILLEGYSRHGAGREEQVRNSLYLALEAQKYLRTMHGVTSDVYLAVSRDGQGSATDFIRISVFADAFSAIHVARVGAPSR
ncbi:hypothetical protein [Geobacter pickeringii]|uniref:hypothetical protein n=1 Tax=Geobacter pickeringii TaxID=345632 RepID=UPI00068C1D63|nr:hypothetical protein [Geobacter pickeringii]